MSQNINQGKSGAQLGGQHIAGAHQLKFGVDKNLPDWGAGFNTFGYQWENFRTAFASSVLTPGSVANEEGDSASLHVLLCKSEDDFASEVCSGVEAGAAYSGVEVKGSASFLYSSKVDATSSLVVAHVKVCRKKEQLPRDQIVLSGIASKLMETDPVDFVRHYGNYFHSARLVGGHLVVVLHFKSSSLHTKASLDANLKVSLENVGDIGAKLKSCLEHKKTETSMEISVFHTGGNPPPTNTTGPGSSIDTDALIEYAMGFESSLSDQNSVTFEAIYDDFGGVGGAGSEFRDVLMPKEKVLDHLTDTLHAYRPLLDRSDYALRNKEVIGFSTEEIETLQNLSAGLSHDIEAIQDLIRETTDITILQDPKGLVAGNILRNLPEYYADKIGEIDLNPRKRGVDYGTEVNLYLESKGVFISAAEYGGVLDQVYYGKLGRNPIRLKFAQSSLKEGKLQNGDQVFIQTTESMSKGYKKKIYDLNGAFGDYVGWRCTAGTEVQLNPLRFTIRKCTTDDDPVIKYGDRVWIESENERSHLEYSGPKYPNYLGLRGIKGKPGQYWVIRKPAS